MSTPVKFLELTIQNFMAYGNNVTAINLDFKEPVLIVGKNHDAIVNGQVDSNGAGKSAILDALSFVLYDKTISNKEKSELINNINKKNLEVTLTFLKDNVQYKISRMRKTKTKADVQLLVMDEDGEYRDKTPDSIANTNREIERILGLPFDIFARIVVFSATFQPFLDLPSRSTAKASQTSIMEELFGYTELTEKAESLKEKIKGVKTEFSHIEELQEQIQREVRRLKDQYTELKEKSGEWDENYKRRISEAEKEIESLSEVDFDKERKVLATIEASQKALADLTSRKKVAEAEIKGLQDRVDSIEEQKEKIEDLQKKVTLIEEKLDFKQEEKIISKLASLEEDDEDISQEKQSKRKEKSSTLEEIEDIKGQIGHLEDDECPYCGQDFEGSAEKVKELAVKSTELADKVKQLEADISALDVKLGENSTAKDKLKKKSKVKGEESELRKIKTRYDSFKTQLETYSEDSIDDTVFEQIEEKKDDVLSLISQIEAEEDIIQGASDRCSYGSLAEVEKDAARLETLKERFDELISEDNPHHDTMMRIDDTINELELKEDKSEDLNEMEETLRHQEFLLKLLTKKDSFVRKNLLDRSLPFLNKRLMGYLEKLGLPHRVEFQPDMSAHISQFGTELSFTSLSSGQRARVNLALAFAFRDVLQARYGKIGFCMLDECLDVGLGNAGVQLAANMIKKIAIEDKMSMFVISHRDEVANMFGKQLVVELQDGFSNVTSQPT